MAHRDEQNAKFGGTPILSKNNRDDRRYGRGYGRQGDGGRFHKGEHMDCPHCGLCVPDGTARCPNCLRAMPRPGLLHWLARALGLGGRAWPSMQVTNRTTEIRTRIQLKDGRGGETKTYSSLADVPAEIRQQIEQAKAGEALTKITVRD